MVSKDNADIVRDWLALDPRADWEADPDEFGDAVAALDALVAERDECCSRGGRMSDHADSGEYGLHTNWENCEGGPCCDEALAIMKALVAERDEWEVAAKKISGARNRWKKRAEAAEAENVLLREALTKILYASENNQEMSIIARFDAIHAAARAALGEDA